MTSYSHFPLLVFYIIPLKYLLVLVCADFTAGTPTVFNGIFLTGDEDLKELQSLYHNSIFN